MTTIMKRGSDSSRASDISITLYYRESGHHTSDAFPVLINNRPIEECIYSTNEDLIDLALYLQQDEQLFYRIQEWFETWEVPLTTEAPAAVVRSEGEKLRNKLQVHLNNKQLGFAVEFQKRPVYKLKLMNEFTVIWPLWCESYVDCRPYLSPALQARVTAWATHFNTFFTTASWGEVDPDWQSAQQGVQHREEGRELRRLLQEELNAHDQTADWHVYLDLWECKD